MVAGTTAFLAGAWLLHQCARLPDIRWCWLALPAAALLLQRRRWMRVTGALVLGLLWALWHAHATLATRLDARWEGVDLEVTGRIVGLPGLERPTRFRFDTEAGDLAAMRLRLSWYGEHPPLRAGARWRLVVRLKRPSGFANPGGFDYEGWLFRNGIDATGYVRPKEPATRIAPPSPWYWQAWRQRVRERLQPALGAHRMTPVVLALALGERAAIEDTDWDTMRRTGVTHLLAISGLHIGLVAWIGFQCARRVWPLWPRLPLWCPSQKAGALAALIAALGYALLAGLSIPTRRAIVMLAVALGAIWLQRHTQPIRALCVAALLVVLIEPSAPLEIGFWLSFSAVALLLYAASHRPPPRNASDTAASSHRHWKHALRAQWWVSLGMFPLVAAWFGRVPLLGPVVNLLAIPYVGLLVVPLVLAGTVLLVPVPALGAWLLHAALALLDCGWPILEWAAAFDGGQWMPAVPAAWHVVLALTGAALCLAPGGVPLRVPGVMLLLPLLLAQPERPAPGAAWFTLLDVGQGLAAVIETRGHVLVYDTGPRFGPSFDAGSAVVVPFLQMRGHRHVDMAIVSHGDQDHDGGLASLRATLPIGELRSGTPAGIAAPDVQPCRDGDRWQWDDVQFSVLHPGAPVPARPNDASCVLSVKIGSRRILLPGDIEANAERRLLDAHRQRLPASVLVAPHHGSRSSSTAAFLDAVRPQYALFPVGYRNRFGFPKPDVITRYQAVDADRFDTARSGAIELRIDPQRGITRVIEWREQLRRFWHRRDTRNR